MRARLCLALAVILLAPAARGLDGVVPGAALHAWGVWQDGVQGTDVRYDPAAQAFNVDRYLAPGSTTQKAYGLATLSLDGSHLEGDLRWRLAVDTGTVERRRSPLEGRVCWSRGTATGLANVGQGECSLFRSRSGTLRRVFLPVQEAGDGAPAWTANGRSFEDELRNTAFVREAWISYALGRAGFLRVTAGRLRLAVADGYVHDDVVTGARATADLGAIGPPFEVTAAVFSPERDWPLRGDALSPMGLVRVDWLPSLFERVGVFAAALQDRSGGAAELLRDALVEREVATAVSPASSPLARAWAQRTLAFTLAAPLHDEATLWWVGASGSLLPWRGQRVAFTAAFAGGQLSSVESSWVKAERLVTDLRVRGQLASVRWEGSLGSLRASASFLYASGGELPRAAQPTSADESPAPITGTYRGFLGVTPLLSETSIFFRGGLSQQLGARLATAPGVNGRGVLAPVLGLGWDPSDAVELDLRGAYLRADAAGPFGGRTYGTEVDLVARWEVTGWLRLGAEADVLLPGDFYPSRQAVKQGILAMDVVTP